jgi:uncharacterized damage-inducible protein DinB
MVGSRRQETRMSASTLLHSLFKYKAWINEQLFRQMEKLDPEAHAADRHTAIRILNHVYVVDRIFAAHLCGKPHAYTMANTADTPTLEALAAAVAESDRWYVEYTRNLAPETLAEEIAFAFTDGDRGLMTREEMLAHVSTHGAYHRGGVGRILSVCGVQPPRDIFTTYLHAAEPQRRETLTA